MWVILAVTFEGGEGFFDGVEIRRIRRKEEQESSGAFNEFPRFIGFVKRGIVQNDHHLWLEPGTEFLLQPEVENFGIAGSGKQEGRMQDSADQPAKERSAGTPLPGAHPVNFLSSESPAIGPAGGRFKPAFIHVDKGLPLIPVTVPAFEITSAFLPAVQRLNVTPRFFYG
jgi:hypothetical protein